jgi:hypothetical protein
MRRALLLTLAIAFALACGDDITEPTTATPATGATAIGAKPLFATTTTEDGLSISTDKDDYQPGDVVHFTGYGWQPGDVLDIVLTDEPATADPHTWSVSVGADGMFHDSTYVVDEGDLDVAFTLVATSRATGRSLTVRFTDSNPGVPSVTGQTPNPVPAGTSATYTVSIPFGGNSNSCTVTLTGTAVSTPSATWPTASGAGFFSFSPSSVSSSGQTQTSTLTVTIPESMAPNTYVFRVGETFGPSGCNGNPQNSQNINLVVGPPLNVPPVVDAGGPYSGNRNTPVSLGGATATDRDNDALKYAWTYAAVSGVPAGTTCLFNDATVIKPAFTCTNVGVFKVTLTVDDQHGHVVADDAQVTVANGVPSAKAGGPYNGAEGSAVTLDGSGTDPDQDALTYKWTAVPETGVDAGATCSFDDDTKADAKVTCTDDGTFKLTLTVKDPDNLTNGADANLVLTNAKPNASAGGPPGGYSGNEGSPIQLDGAGADPGTNDHLTYKWTISTTGIDAGGACAFDDDTKEDPKLTCTDDSFPGQFTLSLVVKDDDGGTSDVATAKIAVDNVKPVANAGGGETGYSGAEGSAIQLAGTADDPGDNDDAHLTYQWSVNTNGIDAGGTCTFDNPSDKNAKVTCTDDSGNAAGGHFKLTLLASDDEGNASVPSFANLTVTNSGPVADAGGGDNGYSGYEGSPVQLNGSVTDAGTNDTHVWSWKYVPGSNVDAGATCSFYPSATAEDPKITCTDDGTVELTLNVKDDDGAEGTDIALLKLANVAPVADAGDEDGVYSGAEGGSIALSGSKTDAGSNDTHTYLWTSVPQAGVDAGATCSFTPSATVLSPTVSCTDDGTFKLTLKVTDDDNGVGTDDATLILTNADPVADAGGGTDSKYEGAEGTPVQLNGTVTDAGANDTHTWSWKYLAGTNVDPGATCSFYPSETAEDPKITCTDDGTVELTLTVRDDNNGTGTDKATLELSNVNPVATATGPTSGTEGQVLQLTGTKSDKGTNDVLTPTWSFAPVSGVDAGAICSFGPNASTLSPTVSCTDDGTYKLTLTVNDDDNGVGTANFDVTLTNADPVADAGGGVNEQYTGNEGSPVKLNGSASDAGTNDTFHWSWQYTAGTGFINGATCTIDYPNKQSPNITCNDNGTVSLTLTVTDDDGGSGTDGATLTVNNVNPVATAVAGTGTEGAAVTLTGSKTDVGSNDTHAYLWTYAAGAGVDAGASCTITNPTTLNASINCNDDGTYQVTLKVTDDDGGAGTDVASMTVSNTDPLISSFTKSDGTDIPLSAIIGTTLNLKAVFSDLGTHDTHLAQIDCGMGYADVNGSGDDVSPVQSSCTFASIGTKTVGVKITDDDGGVAEKTQQILIAYNFSGFFAPVDRPNTMNVSKAGQAIPLKWRLTDAANRPITDLTTVTVKTVNISCDAAGTSDMIEEYATTNTGLINLGDGNYQFNWKTPTNYAGTCKSIALVFGSAGGLGYTEKPSAYFTFKK